MGKRKKSRQNFIFATLNQIITLVFGLLLPRLFLVGYGSEVNGLLNSLSQILVYLGLFEAGIGAATMQALYKPVAREDWGAINGVLAATDYYYKRAGLYYFISLVIFSLVYPLLVNTTLSFATVCGVVFFSGIGNVVLFWVQGKYRFLLETDGKLYIVTNLNTGIFVVTSLAKIVLIARGANVVLILAAVFAISLLQVFYIVYYVHRVYPQLDLKVEADHTSISQKSYALVHQISTLIFNNTDVIILTFVCGLKTVSVYSLFKLITSHLNKILWIFPGSVNFVMGQTYHTDREKYTRYLDLVESGYSVLLYGFYAVAFYLFLPFMRLYTAGVTDANYIDPALPIFFVLIELLSGSRGVIGQTISYAGHFRQTLSRTITESAINLTVSLVGVCFWGIYGVLLGTIVALAYRTNDIIIYVNIRLLGRKPWRTYSIYLTNVVLFVVLQFVFKTMIPEPTSWLQFILVGTGTLAISLTVLLLGQILCQKHVREAIRAWCGKMLKKQ